MAAGVGGAITGGGGYPAGTTVTLTAMPDAGHTFANWTSTWDDNRMIISLAGRNVQCFADGMGISFFS